MINIYDIIVHKCSFFLALHFYSDSKYLKSNENHTSVLTHWGRVTHICVGNLTIIGSDNGLAPGRRQAIIWTNAGILSIGHLGTNFSEILIEIYTFPFKKKHLKWSSGKWRPFCLGLNVLIWRNHSDVSTSGVVQMKSFWMVWIKLTIFIQLQNIKWRKPYVYFFDSGDGDTAFCTLDSFNKLFHKQPRCRRIDALMNSL